MFGGGALRCEIGSDLPACIRLLELENTKTQGRHFGAKIASCGFCIREFEEAKMCAETTATEQPQRIQTPENKNNRRSQ
ncbi:hypothetical protein FRC0126_00300 [Corynebacterium diphtheriae]|nr:hypothetical protein FRC0126_00300 [Corynebacterium diphtheriae]